MNVHLGHVTIVAALITTGCANASEPPDGPRALLPRIAFDELDEDEDNAIDDTEFKRVADALFVQLDTDRDNRLSESEYRRLLERPRQRRGHRRPWPEGGGGGWPGGGSGPY